MDMPFPPHYPFTPQSAWTLFALVTAGDKIKLYPERYAVAENWTQFLAVDTANSTLFAKKYATKLTEPFDELTPYLYSRGNNKAIVDYAITLNNKLPDTVEMDMMEILDIHLFRYAAAMYPEGWPALFTRLTRLRHGEFKNPNTMAIAQYLILYYKDHMTEEQRAIGLKCLIDDFENDSVLYFLRGVTVPVVWPAFEEKIEAIIKAGYLSDVYALATIMAVYANRHLKGSFDQLDAFIKQHILGDTNLDVDLASYILFKAGSTNTIV